MLPRVLRRFKVVWTVTPTYAVIPVASSVNEGSSLQFNVTTTSVDDGTTLYWVINSNAGDFSVSSGSFSITSNAGNFSVTPLADFTTEGAETFTVSVRTGSIAGPTVVTSSSVTINDASLTPVGSWNYKLLPDPTVYHAEANPNPWVNDPIALTDPGRPAGWATGQVAGYYYVDLGNTTGLATDTGRTYGTPTAPRLTLPPLPWINDGTGSSVIRVEITGQKTGYTTITARGIDEDHMVWVVGDPNRTRPQFIDNELRIYDCQYAVIQHLERTGPYAVIPNDQSGAAIASTATDVHHLIVRDIVIQNIAHRAGGKSGLSVVMSDAQNTAGAQMYSIIIKDITLAHLGDTYTWSSFDYDFHGIQIDGYSNNNANPWDIRHLWILDVTTDTIAGDAVQVTGQAGTGDARDTLHHYYIGKVSEVGNRQVCVGLKTCSHVIVSECLLDGHYNEVGGFGQQYNGNHLYYVNCQVNQATYGTRRTDQYSMTEPSSTPVTYHFYYNCLLTDIQPFGGETVQWGDTHEGSAIFCQRGNSSAGINYHALFCTVYSSRRCYAAIQDATANHVYTLSSSILHRKQTFGTENPSYPSVHYCTNDAIAPYVSLDRNLIAIDHAGEAFKAKMNGVVYTDMTTWKARTVAAGTVKDTNTIIGSARWTNPTANVATMDFSIAVNSDAKGLGRFTTPNGLDFRSFYMSKFGVDPAIDFNGNPRSLTTPSAGAFE